VTSMHHTQSALQLIKKCVRKREREGGRGKGKSKRQSCPCAFFLKQSTMP
jgi:hypothetical protein